MSLKYLLYPAFIVGLLYLPHGAQAQQEVGESIEASKESMRARTDSLYFEAEKAKMKNDDALALRLFEQFAALRPEVADGFYELSKLTYNEKKLDKAEAYVLKAIALDGKNKWYKDTYANIVAEKGDFAQAAKIMTELSNAEPQDVNYLLTAAEYYMKAKQYEQSLSYLDKALARRGPDEDIIMLKEHIYLSMNDVEKAADMVRLLIDQDPRSGKYYKALGDLYDNNKLSAKAAVVYENAEKKLPGDPYIQAGRAEHFLRVGDTAKYVSYMSKAIVSKDLEAESQMEWLGEFIQTLPSDSVIRINAMPITRQLVQQHPEDAQIYSLYGSMLESNSQMDSAAWAYARSLQLKSSIETWRKLLDNFLVRQLGDSVVKYSERFIRSYPNQVEPQYYNAQGHYIKKEYDKAIKAINRAIDNQPENNKVALSSLYATMAEMYHSNKQEDFSEKAYDKALSLDADNAATLNNYAYNLSVLGKRLDDAERMSKRSLDLKPGFGAYLDTYGWILYKKGEFEKAKIFVKKSIDVSGNTADGTLYDHLGDIYYKLNAKDKALENWKIAKSLKVDNPLIDKKISEGKLYE